MAELEQYVASKKHNEWYIERFTPGWLESVERQYTIFEMRKRGMTLRDIALATSLSVSTVKKDIEAVTKELKEQTIERANEYTETTLAILDDVIKTYYESAVTYKNEKKLQVLLNALKQRTELLGLNKDTSNPAINNNEIKIVFSDDWRNPVQQEKELSVRNDIKIDEKISLVDVSGIEDEAIPT